MGKIIPSVRFESAADIENWEVCPHCRNGQVEGGHVTIEGRVAIQEVNCTNCDSEWTEVYEASYRRITNA